MQAIVIPAPKSANKRVSRLLSQAIDMLQRADQHTDEANPELTRKCLKAAAKLIGRAESLLKK